MQESALGGLCQSLWICTLSKCQTARLPILHDPRARWVAAYPLEIPNSFPGVVNYGALVHGVTSLLVSAGWTFPLCERGQHWVQMCVSMSCHAIS